MMSRKDIANAAFAAKSRDAFVDQLIADGFKYLNEGCFGATFGRGKSFIVKVGKEGRAHRDGYVAYAEWLSSKAKETKLPEFPQISHFSKHGSEQESTDWFVAIVERLEEMPDDGAPRETMHAIRQSASMGDKVAEAKLPETARKAAAILREKFAKDWNFDLHAGNFMMRSSQVVITDPLSYPR